jgi:hypothetical protein
VGEALVEAANYVEDEGAVCDNFPESAEVINHLLEAVAVLDNGEVALDEDAEPRLKLDGAFLPVLKELGLTASQESQAVPPWEEVISARSSVRELRIQDLTTQSI